MPDESQPIGKHKTRVLTDEDGQTKVIYHDTAVVTFDHRYIILDTGGWWTRTTKLRMNQASKHFGLAYEIHQVLGDWILTYQYQGHLLAAEKIRLDRWTGEVQPLA